MLCGIFAVAKGSSGSGVPTTELEPCNETTISVYQQKDITDQCLGKFVLRDCCDTKMLGRLTGIYWIAATEIIEERQKGVCDTKTRGGGWLVISRRLNAPTPWDPPSTEFVRNWVYFEEGFGQLGGNFWWGLQKIHQQTNLAETELLMEFRVRDTNEWKYVHYERFHVGGRETNYSLTLDGYSGNVSSSFDKHNGTQFSTWDADNSGLSFNCLLFVSSPNAGWWTGTPPLCVFFHPLGKSSIYFLKPNLHPTLDFDTFEMKIRPKHFPCTPPSLP